MIETTSQDSFNHDWMKRSKWRMDAKLNNNSYKRTASQCKTKIHNLEQKYNKGENLDETRKE